MIIDIFALFADDHVFFSIIIIRFLNSPYLTQRQTIIEHKVYFYCICFFYLEWVLAIFILQIRKLIPSEIFHHFCPTYLEEQYNWMWLWTSSYYVFIYDEPIMGFGRVRWKFLHSRKQWWWRLATWLAKILKWDEESLLSIALFVEAMNINIMVKACDLPSAGKRNRFVMKCIVYFQMIL